jgi:hypothetical protein
MTRITSILIAIALCSPLWADRYVDNGDGTVTDTATSLMWLKDASAAGQQTHISATNYCDNLVTNGYSDWRLPSVSTSGGAAELNTLFRAGGNPAGAWEGTNGTPFVNVDTAVPTGNYWSSSKSPTPDYYWYLAIGLEGGISDQTEYDGSVWVWPVRTYSPPILIRGTSISNIVGSVSGGVFTFRGTME